MATYDVIIIGGGPAGITAAIFAKRSGRSVLILEKMPKLGKKLLITGAGRCNLLNEKLDASFYKPEARKLVGAVLKEFGKEKILEFFKGLGLHVYTDDTGRMFPVTNQAASVLKVLELELERLEIPVELGCEVSSVDVGYRKDPRRGDEATLKRDRFAAARDDKPVYFQVAAKNGKRFMARHMILCGGGKSYPALGADGSTYAFAKKFGHSLVEPVPSTVPLLVKDPWCHFLQGQKVRARVSIPAGERNEKEAGGELLFTQYGLSGTAILDVSDPVSVALNREGKKEVVISVDLVPFLSTEELEKELGRRITDGVPRESLLEGILPHKFSVAIGKGVSHHFPKKVTDPFIQILKHKRFKVHGTRGWNEAEFTAGGIPAEEVGPDLRSKFQEGLYFAGEVLDIQALRGGYQLAWAWASGAAAGNAGLFL